MPPTLVPPVMAVPIKLTVRINYKNFGIGEVYYMQSKDMATALNNANDLLKRRILWLAAGPTIEYAACSFVDTARDAALVYMDRQYGAPPNLLSGAGTPTDTPNDRCSGPEFRMEASGVIPGGWGQRILRACPDDWMDDITAVGDLLALVTALPLPRANGGLGLPTQTGTVLPPLPTLSWSTAATTTGVSNLNGATSQTVLQNYRLSFLDALIRYCGILVRGTTPSLRNTWTVAPYTRIVYRGISDRRTGRPFGEFTGRAAKSY